MALIGTMKYLTIGNNTYEIDGGDLPIASASTLGGIKVGSGLTIDSTTGVLNATGTSITIDNEMSDSSTNPVQNKVIKGYVDNAVSGLGSGTVTSVGLSNATNGGLSISGSPITSSGSITVGHSNVLTSAQTTQAVYPIKIDKNGHISAYGTAVTSMPASDVSAWAKEATKPTYTYSEVGAAASSHTHGNITNDGDITATAPTIANGDQIIINDNSASKITNGPTFDGSTTTKALTPRGTWETFLQSYTESDPIFAASAAAGITSSDISNWNSIVSDDHKWNDVSLTKSATSITSDVYVPCMLSTSATSAELLSVLDGATTAYSLVRRNGSGYVKAATPPANDNSTCVATTAWVKSALPTKTSDLTNDSGFITTDEKLKTVINNDVNQLSHYLIFGTNSEDASTKYIDTTGLKYSGKNGTTSAEGWALLSLGNSTASGVADNKYGILRLYSNTSYDAELIANNLSARRTIYLPNASGTVALTSDIPTVPSNIVNTITTTAGAHTAITSQTGNVSFNVPTKTSHLTNDSGFVTTDTNTTYSLSNALSSHKFTSTLTAGGSGSGTSTATIELAAGTGITLTDDTTNKKITIACSVTNTDEKVKLTSQSTSGTYPLIFGPTSITSNSTYQGYYNTGITVNPNTATVTATTFVGALTGTASGNLTSSSTLDATKLSGAVPAASLTNVKVSSSGSGNVITGLSASNGTITYTLGSVSTTAAQIIRW